MKKTFATLVAIIVAVAGLHAFRAMQRATITGKVVPADGADKVYAINGTDSIKIKPTNGTFTFTIKPGSWTVLIDAREPLKDVVLDVAVREGNSANLGEIKLQQ